MMKARTGSISLSSEHVKVPREVEDCQKIVEDLFKFEKQTKVDPMLYVADKKFSEMEFD